MTKREKDLFTKGYMLGVICTSFLFGFLSVLVK